MEVKGNKKDTDSVVYILFQWSEICKNQTTVIIDLIEGKHDSMFPFLFSIKRHSIF
jgi:hypothetical protein